MHSLVPSKISGIHWESWTTSPVNEGEPPYKDVKGEEAKLRRERGGPSDSSCPESYEAVYMLHKNHASCEYLNLTPYLKLFPKCHPVVFNSKHPRNFQSVAHSLNHSILDFYLNSSIAAQFL